jgi:hypothetical protein
LNGLYIFPAEFGSVPGRNIATCVDIAGRLDGGPGRPSRPTDVHNPENGFCVLRVKARGQRDLITILGHAAMISAGEFVQASGAWVNDRTYGGQFRASCHSNDHCTATASARHARCTSTKLIALMPLGSSRRTPIGWLATSAASARSHSSRSAATHKVLTDYQVANNYREEAAVSR